jgi:hypothetical protein
VFPSRLGKRSATLIQLLFDASTDNNAWEDATVEVQSMKDGRRRTLVQGGYFGHYIHGADPFSGHLIYIHGGTLFAAPGRCPEKENWTHA